MTDNFKELTQANVTAQQYAALQACLTGLQEDRRYETRRLIKMILLSLLVGWFAYQIFTEGTSPMPASTALLMAGWVGCAPAGVMGLMRRRSEKGYFVFGTLLFFLFLYIFYFVIGMFTGVFFLIAQICRVIRINREIPQTNRRIRQYQNTIYG